MSSLTKSQQNELLPRPPDSDILKPAYRLLSPVKRSVAAKLSPRSPTPPSYFPDKGIYVRRGGPGPGSYKLSYSWADKPCYRWQKTYGRVGNNYRITGRNPYGDIRIPDPTPFTIKKSSSDVYDSPPSSRKGFTLYSRLNYTGSGQYPGPADYTIPSEFDKYIRMSSKDSSQKQVSTFGCSRQEATIAPFEWKSEKEGGYPGPGTYYTPDYDIDGRVTSGDTSFRNGFSLSSKWFDAPPKPAPGPTSYSPSVPGQFPAVVYDKDTKKDKKVTPCVTLPSMMKGAVINGRLKHPMDDDILGHQGAKTSLPYNPNRRIRARVRA